MLDYFYAATPRLPMFLCCSPYVSNAHASDSAPAAAAAAPAAAPAAAVAAAAPAAAATAAAHNDNDAIALALPVGATHAADAPMISQATTLLVNSVMLSP